MSYLLFFVHINKDLLIQFSEKFIIIYVMHTLSNEQTQRRESPLEILSH